MELQELLNKNTEENSEIVTIEMEEPDAILDAATVRFLSEVEVEGITKEQDEEIMKIKQRQMFLDDVGVTVAMIAVTLLAVSVVLLKIDPNATTFTPLDQQVQSRIKYTGNGFIPCDGYLPCSEDYSGG